jgi:prepilin-type N-terminal cleavage/methylation domain-containing protein
MTLTTPAILRRRTRGFTLTELLVVISIIVLLLAIAVPLFNVLRGGRSVDSGQNVVSAMLQRARARAIGIQQRRGVFFFNDQTNDRTAMLMVRFLDGTAILEVDEESSELEYLPTGIGVASILPGTPDTAFRPCALIVFDGVGRIEAGDDYQLKVTPPTPTTLLVQQFGTNVGAGSPGADVVNKLGQSPATAATSEPAFALYDRRGLADQKVSTDPGVNFSPEQITWLDQNSVAIVINRYNGTLIRGE